MIRIPYIHTSMIQVAEWLSLKDLQYSQKDILSIFVLYPSFLTIHIFFPFKNEEKVNMEHSNTVRVIRLFSDRKA